MVDITCILPSQLKLLFFFSSLTNPSITEASLMWCCANNDLFGLQTKEVGSETHFLGQSEITTHFGLGSETGNVNVKVTWPGGLFVVALTDVQPNTRIRVVKPRLVCACNIKLSYNGKRETKAPLLYAIPCFIHSYLYLFYLYLFVCSRQLDSKQSTSFNNLTVCSTLQIIAIEKQVHSKYIINLIKYPHEC